MCAQDGVIEWVSPESLPAGKFDDVSCMKRRLLHADDAAFQAHADVDQLPTCTSARTLLQAVCRRMCLCERALYLV
jgi:hypothetical protein